MPAVGATSRSEKMVLIGTKCVTRSVSVGATCPAKGPDLYDSDRDKHWQ